MKTLRAVTIAFFDPHFHVWDVRAEGVWDGAILFKPDGKEVFDIHGYESIMRSNIPGSVCVCVCVCVSVCECE